MWRAVVSACRAGCYGYCCRCCHAGRLPGEDPITGRSDSSVRRRHQGGPPAVPAAVLQVRRQSGPPRVRTRLSNQETQILMTTLNGPTSAVVADVSDGDV